MEDKTYSVRIESRYDTEADWLAIDPVLFEGELAVVVVKSDQPNTEPEIRVKSGDGIHKYSELKFISASAYDVYNWAKQKNKPTYHASEIIGLNSSHTHKIEDILGLQEALDNKSNNTGPDDTTSGTIEGPLGQSIIAPANGGLKITQSGEDIIIEINRSQTFMLDGGDSSQFQTI